MSIHFMIVCRSGVLAQGMSLDFLGGVLRARIAKEKCAADFPHSRFRVQLSYANGLRVPAGDIKSALRALSDKTVLAQVESRLQSRAAA